MCSFGLGFSPPDSALIKNLTQKGYSTDDFVDAGLVLPRNSEAIDANKPVTDRFRGRLTIPIRDRKGDVLGFGARVLQQDFTGPKYLNSPTTAAFTKSNGVFGIDLALSAIRREDCAIVVEGYFDVIALHNAGVDNAVAIMGTAAKAAQIDLVARLSRAGKVFLLLDGDSAGQNARESLCLNVLPYVRMRNANVRMLRLPQAYKDAAEFLMKHNKQEFMDVVIKGEGVYWKVRFFISCRIHSLGTFTHIYIYFQITGLVHGQNVGGFQG